MQPSCLRLMGKKLPVSLGMEGNFCWEGLQSLEEDDDMLTAIARELVTQKGVGESADIVWRQIQAEHSKNCYSQRHRCHPGAICSDGDTSATTPDRPGSCQHLEVRRPATSAPDPAARGAFPGTRTVLAVLTGARLECEAQECPFRSQRSAWTSALQVQLSGPSAASTPG